MPSSPSLRTSVLIASYGRPHSLVQCLAALCRQTSPADEVFVVWQGDDHPTKRAAEGFGTRLPPLRVLHNAEQGVVPSENLALSASNGEIILLIDDDAVAPVDWIERHLAFYVADKAVGAVGGPADNFMPDGSRFPRRDSEPLGRLKSSGALDGNMYDHPLSWRNDRLPRQVQHLVGYNMSLRRRAFDRFEPRLRRYWQLFELDACLQVQQNGFRVMFDFANVVEHHPTNTAFVGGRGGDLLVKAINPSFNLALILSKHTRGFWRRSVRFWYLLMIGSVSSPGLMGSLIAWMRFGNARREYRLFLSCLEAKRQGWRDGKPNR